MSKPTAVRTNASALLVPCDKSVQRFLVLQQGCEQRQGQRAGGHIDREMVPAQEQSTALITHVPPQGQRRGRCGPTLWLKGVGVLHLDPGQNGGDVDTRRHGFPSSSRCALTLSFFLLDRLDRLDNGYFAC
jgi:hypothetical protein